MYARSSSHASRGRIQRIASGATPLSSSQMHASIAVLPRADDRVAAAGSASATRPLTGMNAASGSTANEGVCVEGIGVSRYVASTTLRRTRTVVVSPVRRETKWCSLAPSPR